MARSSSDGVAICYVLLVLWMTLCFHTMWPMGQNQDDVMFRRVHQVAVPVWTLDNYSVLDEFVRVRHRGQNLLSTIAMLLLLRNAAAYAKCGPLIGISRRLVTRPVALETASII